MRQLPHDTGFRVTNWRGIHTETGLLADGSTVPPGVFRAEVLNGMLRLGQITPIEATPELPDEDEDDDEQEPLIVQPQKRRGKRGS